MKKVKITMLTPFEKISDKKEIEMDFNKGETFKDLVDKMVNKFGNDFKNKLLNNGKIRDSVMVMNNGRTISTQKDSGFSEKLKNNQEYVFCAVIGGG